MIEAKDLPLLYPYHLKNPGQKKLIIRMNLGQKRLLPLVINALRLLYPELLRRYLYPEGYISGVLKGDGFCTTYIGLHVKDLDFAEAFASAMHKKFQIELRPRQEAAGYWIASKSNARGIYTYLKEYVPSTEGEKAAWLRGMFDSEGNAYLGRVPSKGANSYQRRVAMYSTNTDTLERAKAYMAEIEIAAIIRAMKSSATHLGTKIVYELRVQQNKQIFERFATRIGSSIARKQETLDAIVKSYVDNLSLVLREIRSLIEKGIKPTQPVCQVLPRYNGIARYFQHAELVKMAMEISIIDKESGDNE